MKFRYVVLLLLFLSSAAFAQTNSDRGYRVKVGDTVPNIVLHLTDGTTTSLQQLRGKVVVLQFTASWCSVCRKEMPHLESEIWQTFKDNSSVWITMNL